ncbi:inversin isoform X1 [Colossoma macropomum]|uniref:inversin isoform X1 n=1 Tax=Colossoma macropomum TaxID=42526 RepID=UPI00186421DA|nr:inversin isoform X1 [Colossoma macropomum]XP_036413924.1 inversin isoform X1 [Colossoma macropomum]
MATQQSLKSSGSTTLSSQVHAAAVNGDRSSLQKLITAEPCLRDSEDQFGRTPLMYCVLADRLDCAETLLKAGASVNKADHSKRTALHLAAQKGNVRFMKLLLSRHADWLLKDLEEMTPLHLATRHSSSKPLSLLLKHMAPGEVDTQDRNKQTALHWSAFYNHPEHVKLLIKHDSNIGIPDSEGKIPLHWAAHNKHPNATHTVRCILEAAPTESLLNWQDYEGRTPLHFAVADGNEAVVEVLTSYDGCNVTAYDNLFRTPLHWAALLGHARIVHMLLERNKSGMIPSDSQGATPLHYGAQSNYADTVAVFLKHPSVRDEPDLEGRTAFMWAAGKGSDDVIKTMLELKEELDINMADKYGGTALHAAALSGHVSTVRLLLEKGAMVDPLDVMKHTPLFRACEMGHRDVILTLIKGGARVDLVDIDGHSALHWAALGGNAEVCEVLMENGISPNLQDQAGRTPLQCAAYAGYINCMALLIQHNADPNIQDKEGRTALHWSCNNGYLDAVKLLLGCGAFPNHMEHTEERYTPLDYALLGEHQEVTQFLLEHGAMSIAAIQDIAASTIQALYKGYKVRRAFRERKNLLMRHEQLRKDAAKKREEERRREAEQQLSLAEAELQEQMSFVQVGGKRPSLVETEHNIEVQEPVMPKGLKPRKPSKVHHSQIRTDKKQKHKEHRPETETPETPHLSVTLTPPVTSLGVKHSSDTKTVVCESEECITRRERHSPAGSSRPGSARPAHTGSQSAPGPTETTLAPRNTAHSRPRTSGSHSRASSAACSKAPHTASTESSTETHSKPVSRRSCSAAAVQQPSSLGFTEKPYRTKRQKERRTDKEKEKDTGTEREGEKVVERDKNKGTRPETEKGRRKESEKKKQVEKEREHKRKSLYQKNQAARIIQTAWRRSSVQRRLREVLCGGVKRAEPAEVIAILIQILWDQPVRIDLTDQKTISVVQSPSIKAAGKKSSVLQNIYGGAQAKRGRSLRTVSALNTHSQSQLLLDLSLKTNKQLSGMECVHVLDSLSQAKQFSYHLRPQSTSSQSSHNRTKE